MKNREIILEKMENNSLFVILTPSALLRSFH